MLEVVVIIHNIRSAHNVGSMFRTADAIGVKKLYITGYSPCPIDRFGRPVKEIAKTALGAENSIPWEYHKEPGILIKELKIEGYTIVGLEQDERAVDYKQYLPQNKTTLIVGEEVLGISPEIRDLCDDFIEIPMRGEKESLNVSVAFGVAVFRLLDQQA